MNRPIIMFMALSLCILPTSRTKAQHKTNSGAEKKPGTPTIALTELKIGDKTLELRYKIKNGSDHDIWICDREGVYSGAEFEVYIAEDNQTLVIHRRLDNLPEYDYRHEPYGHYIRLRVGEECTESLSLSMPVNAKQVYMPEQRLQGIKHARRIAIEIGYYADDLPKMVRDILKEAERLSDTRLDHDREITNKCYFGGLLIRDFFGGILHFNELNESLRSRDEEVLIPYSHHALKGENALQIMVDGLLIPYEERKEWWPQPRLPNLTSWSRIEIDYKPSALEYFFPYANQQNLLSHVEKQQLLSLKNNIVKSQKHLKEFAYELSKGSHGGIVAERSAAYVTCYRDDKYLTSFTVHDNTSIETEEKHWFWYRKGLKSIKVLTPQIQPFDFRVQCASHLKDLWYRLLLYHEAEKKRLKESTNKTENVYPDSMKWCDLMIRAYRAIGMLDENIMRPLICPGAGEGKCHYAMNLNCKPDSPPDTVLLFETKAGWNQHGGPELFNFDNHDPKGGCVLLNDGTVKFIRTNEELHQLRWK